MPSRTVRNEIPCFQKLCKEYYFESKNRYKLKFSSCSTPSCKKVWRDDHFDPTHLPQKLREWRGRPISGRKFTKLFIKTSWFGMSIWKWLVCIKNCHESSHSSFTWFLSTVTFPKLHANKISMILIRISIILVRNSMILVRNFMILVQNFMILIRNSMILA